MADPKQPPKRRRPKLTSPRAVLEQIAADPSAPIELRLRAASRLLQAEAREAVRKPGRAGNGAATEAVDAVTARALEIMASKNGRLN